MQIFERAEHDVIPMLEKVSLLVKSFEDQLIELRKENTEEIKRRLLATKDLKTRSKLLTEQIESNVPATSDVLDKLMDEEKDNVLHYLQCLSFRVKAALSLETRIRARVLAEKGVHRARQLYRSMRNGCSNPGISYQDVYNAYFHSCLDLFISCKYKGHFEFAQHCLYEAKAAAEENHNDDDIVLAQILEADLLLARSETIEAIENILQPLLKTNLSEDNRGLLLQILGNGCRSSAQWKEAKSHLRESIRIARRLGDRVSEYDRITDLGSVYRSEGRIADADEHQACHMAVAFSRGDSRGIIKACNNMDFSIYLFYIYLHDARYTCNIVQNYYDMTPEPDRKRVLSLFKEENDYRERQEFETTRDMAANTLDEIFNVFLQRKIPVSFLIERMETIKGINFLGSEGKERANLGTIPKALTLGPYEHVMTVFNLWQEVVKATGNISGEGVAIANAGTAYRALGMYNLAIKYHRQYQEIASARDDNEGVGIMQRQLALDYLLSEEIENAEKEVKGSILTLESIRAGLGAEDSSKLANFEKNQSEAYNLLQVILVRQDKVREALALSEFARGRAITDIIRDNSAKTPGSANDTWIWKDDILTTTKISKDLVDDVIAEYYRIADEMDTNFLVYSIVTEYLKSTMVTKLSDISEKWLYVWLVKCKNDLFPSRERIIFRRVKLQEMSPDNVAFDEKFFTSLRRSFTKMNVMQRDGLLGRQPSLNPETHASGPENSRDRNIELVLPVGEEVRNFMSLLESVSLSKKMKEESERSDGDREAFPLKVPRRNMQASLRDRAKKNTIDAEKQNEEELKEEKNTEQKWSEMERVAFLSTWEIEGCEKLKLLYQIYLAPLEKELPTSHEYRVPRLTIIPHDFLFSVPFCALRDSNDQYLVERYVISYTPSLRALHLLNESLYQLRKRQGKNKLKVLAVGNPKMAYPEVPELPFAGKEAENVRDVFGAEQCQLAVREKATKELVLSELKNVDILHLATHAYPEDLEEETASQEGDYIMRGCFMLASSGEECDGILKAEEIQNAPCTCQLVLLSCCETGLGKLTGDGVVGLYRAFFASGAAGVIVTLWKIRDDITPLFMEKFYSGFQDTEDVPRALRSAMLFCLKEKNLPPNQWAAFSLIGASKPRNCDTS